MARWSNALWFGKHRSAAGLQREPLPDGASFVPLAPTTPRFVDAGPKPECSLETKSGLCYEPVLLIAAIAGVIMLCCCRLDVRL